MAHLVAGLWCVALSEHAVLSLALAVVLHGALDELPADDGDFRPTDHT